MRCHYTPIRSLPTLSVGEVMKKLKLSYRMAEMYKGATTLENSLSVSYKVQHSMTIGSSGSTPGYLPQQNENMHSRKDLYTHVHK